MGNTGKTVALIAHDHKKQIVAKWVTEHLAVLQSHSLVATETTSLVLKEAHPSLTISTVASGPLGGDQQIGAMNVEGKVDLLIFFTDPLAPHPHDVDVKALTRLATVYNLPMAVSSATADLIVVSGFLS